jgi:hypothetical protein
MIKKRAAFSISRRIDWENDSSHMPFTVKPAEERPSPPSSTAKTLCQNPWLEPEKHTIKDAVILQNNQSP